MVLSSIVCDAFLSQPFDSLHLYALLNRISASALAPEQNP